MLDTTLDVIRAVLKLDPTISVADRPSIMGVIRNWSRPEKPQSVLVVPRLLKRAEVAERLSCSPRTVDRLAREGVICRVMLPGRKRGAGYRQSDVDRLIGE